MGKKSKESIARRQLRLLQEVFKKRIVPINDLADTYSREFKITDNRSLKADLEKLKSLGMPIEVTATQVSVTPIEIHESWKGTLVGERLGKKKSMESKERLAKEVVDFIKDNRNQISTLILGTGTTVYETSKQILACKDELDITTIYTSNLLVLSSFVSSRPLDITFYMVGGTLDCRTGWLRSKTGVEYLSEAPVDGVITSFMGLSLKGFRTAQDYEVKEKLMNLRPHRRCKWVIIPMEWSKIGREDGEIVGEEPDRKGGEAVLDFMGSTRRYVIFTEYPKGILKGRDRERSEILKYWEGKGLEVKRIYR